MKHLLAICIELIGLYEYDNRLKIMTLGTHLFAGHRWHYEYESYIVITHILYSWRNTEIHDNNTFLRNAFQLPVSH